MSMRFWRKSHVKRAWQSLIGLKFLDGCESVYNSQESVNRILATAEPIQTRAFRYTLEPQTCLKNRLAGSIAPIFDSLPVVD